MEPYETEPFGRKPNKQDSWSAHPKPRSKQRRSNQKKRRFKASRVRKGFQ